jgi:hypothetical protein
MLSIFLSPSPFSLFLCTLEPGYLALRGATVKIILGGYDEHEFVFAVDCSGERIYYFSGTNINNLKSQCSNTLFSPLHSCEMIHSSIVFISDS